MCASLGIGLGLILVFIDGPFVLGIIVGVTLDSELGRMLVVGPLIGAKLVEGASEPVGSVVSLGTTVGLVLRSSVGAMLRDVNSVGVRLFVGFLLGIVLILGFADGSRLSTALGTVLENGLIVGD